MPLHPALASRLEKAAVDNGFDCNQAVHDGWLAFTSTHAPLKIWLSAIEGGPILLALSQANVAKALGAQPAGGALPLPSGACEALAVPDIATLHHTLRRAFQLSRSLPNKLLESFEAKTAALPKLTEVERLVVQRVGQDVFREGLLDYWDGRCAVTGLTVRELLRASHVKPWADCATDAERLDVYNGLLLAVHLDAAFDRGFITFEDDGRIRISPALSADDRRALSVNSALKVRVLEDEHRTYLAWHRAKVFRAVPG
ncbi:MAG: HNH endonuclease [Myxococcales bacterium]